ncbi:MAG: response regulator [Chthoniobacterales bacterium]
MPASSKSSAGAVGDILLVEEYEALAAAITSALKKFAPEHRVCVVPSLLEAEDLLTAHPVELLVIDCDPPHRGAVEFFNRVQTLLPDARVLVLAAGTPDELLRGRKQPTAFEFLDKQFDLAGFGTVVKALFGPAATRSRGTLRHLNLADIVPLLCLTEATEVLEVEAPRHRRGEIHFGRGQILHAACGGSEGVAALHEMFGWRSLRLATAERPSDAPRSIPDLWPSVLREALRSIEAPEPSPVEKAVAAPPAEPTRPARKKVVVVDDTEMLRIFVEEILTTADETLQVATAENALTGLEKIRSIVPDLILLDYYLPDLNGDEVCGRLLAEPRTARVPVIMMSGHVSEMATTAALHENVVATLPKPFLSAALIDLVTRTLADPPPFRRRVPPVAATSPPPEAARPAMTQKADGLKPKAEHQGNGNTPTESTAKVTEAPGPSPAPAAPAAAAPPTLQLVTPPAAGQPLSPARIKSASNNAVVVRLPLEVVSMQFSPTLQMAAICARPCSRTVSLHIDPQALSGAFLPEAGFELDRVDLDARGQIKIMRLAPGAREVVSTTSRTSVPIEAVAVLPGNGGRALQLRPAPLAPMKMQLLAAFELAGVELSPSFGVSCLVLKAREGKVRVTFQPEAAETGITFQSAQVLLDRSARIAEILLDAVA